MMNTDLRLPEIKKALYSDLDTILIEHGYKLNKSRDTYKKKSGPNSCDIVFLYNNYSPIFYEVKFSFFLYADFVQEVKKKYSEFSSIPFTEGWDFCIYEGSLDDKLKAEDLKGKMSYYHKLITPEDLETAIHTMKDRLLKFILPLDNELMTPIGLDRFLNTEFNFLIQNLDPEILKTSLIVAKLANNPKYSQLYLYLDGHLEQLKSKGQYYLRMYDTNRLLFKYLFE